MSKKGMRFAQEDVDKMVQSGRIRIAPDIRPTVAMVNSAIVATANAAVDAELRKLGYPIDAQVAAAKKKRPKYGNEEQIVDGIRIPSKREAKRYRELGLLLKSRQISYLARQVRWILSGGVEYVADFQYVLDGALIVEDSKGKRTREYLNKKKQMKAEHGIEILET